MAELRRLLVSPKQLVTLLMLAVINLALFSGYCRSTAEEQKGYTAMQGNAVRSAAQAEAEYEHYLSAGYYDYLSYVQEQAAGQSILSGLSAKSGFVDRNLNKTAADYQKLNGIRLESGENRGLVAVKDYAITDFLLLIAPLLLILELVGDSDTAIGALTRTTKCGRSILCGKRILALVLLTAAEILLLYGGNILYASHYFGAPGFSRAIQSVPDFQLCAIRISVGGFLAVTFLLKLAAVTVIALTVWILLTRFYAILGWMLAVLLLGTEYILCNTVVPTSAVNHLKFLNVFSALDADLYFTQYCNLNWFGFPSGFLSDTAVLMLILLVLLFFLTLFLIGKMYPGKIGQQLDVVKDKMMRKLHAHLPVHNLFAAEGWKLLIAERALLTAAVCAVLGVSLWNDTHLYSQTVDTQKFYTRFSGEITEEKIKKAEKLLNGEKDKIARDENAFEDLAIAGNDRYRIEEAYWRIEEDKIYLERYTGFLNRMTSTRQYAEENGFTPTLIDDAPYVKLFTESAAERRCCMLLLLFIIFASHGICAYDNRYNTRLLLRSTPKGRAHLIATQFLWCCILTAAAATALHGIYLMRVQQEIGLPLPDAAAQNLEMFRWIPFRISLRGCIIMLMVQRFAAAMVFSTVVMGISCICKTPQRAMLLSLVLLILPTALTESGISAIRAFDFLRFLSCCKSALI